jgi:hypothetical protein
MKFVVALVLCSGENFSIADEDIVIFELFARLENGRLRLALRQATLM